VVGRGRWSEQFREDRLERIGPDLIALQGRMQLVAVVHHAVEEPAVLVSESIVDVEEPHGPSIGQPREIVVDPPDRRHHRHVVVAWKDGGEDDGRLWRFAAARRENRREGAGDLRHGGVGPRRAADVVRPGQQHDHLGMDAVQLALLEAPQDVLCLVGAPPEIGRVPAEEVLRPVCEQRRIVCRAPPTCNRVALEVHVDAAGLRLGQQLLVGGHRVLIAARRGHVGRFSGPRRLCARPRGCERQHARRESDRCDNGRRCWTDACGA
jgi:hypothetical protein